MIFSLVYGIDPQEYTDCDSGTVRQVGVCTSPLAGAVRKIGGEKLKLQDFHYVPPFVPSLVWDDRVLNHAYRLFGGIPRVSLQAANEALPEELKIQLTEMTTPAA
jgi:hypothetical protein